MTNGPLVGQERVVQVSGDLRRHDPVASPEELGADLGVERSVDPEDQPVLIVELRELVEPVEPPG